MNLHPVLLGIPQGDDPPPVRVTRQRHYARLALRQCATWSGAPLDGWEQDAAGVPQPQAGRCWSIAHKRLWAAAVIADGPVGIDVEHVVPRRPLLLDAVAGEAEWRLMKERGWHEFFRIWTAKEATLKANGVGIAGLTDCCLQEVPDSRHMVLSFQGRVFRVEQHYHDDHVAAVTCGWGPVTWHVPGEGPDDCSDRISNVT